jgi:CBS domain-containing protein
MEDSMKVKDVMHRGVTWVEPDTPLREVARKMRDDDIGSVPVGENDRLVGMVTDRDIICRGIADSADCAALTAREVMSKPIIYCREDDDLEHAIRVMEKNKIRRLPVISKDKRLIGMLALGDISEIGGQDMAGEVMRSVSAHHA